MSIEGNERTDKLAEERMARNIDSLDVNGREVEEDYIRVTSVRREHSIEMKLRKFVRTVNSTE